MKMNDERQILHKIALKFPDFWEEYLRCEKISSEVIIFGSYAYGCTHPNSDVDILFVGDGKRKSKKYYDFIWIKPDKLFSSVWLSSELALHVAKYGIWVKGESAWKDKVFFSEITYTRKKKLIFDRLIDLYLQRDKLSIHRKQDFIEKIILNTLRLKNSLNKIPNPPTYVTLNGIDIFSLLADEIFNEKLLGRAGKVLMEDTFRHHDIKQILESSFIQLKQKYFGIE